MFIPQMTLAKLMFVLLYWLL